LCRQPALKQRSRVIVSLDDEDSAHLSIVRIRNIALLLKSYIRQWVAIFSSPKRKIFTLRKLAALSFMNALIAAASF